MPLLLLGQEGFDRVRPLSYPGSHIVLLCFSVTDPDSRELMCKRWMPELNHFLPGIPVVLVACKTDLRENQGALNALAREGKTPVSEAEVSVKPGIIWHDMWIDSLAPIRVVTLLRRSALQPTLSARLSPE